MQRYFRTYLRKLLSTKQWIYEWYKKFETTGCLYKAIILKDYQYRKDNWSRLVVISHKVHRISKGEIVKNYKFHTGLFGKFWGKKILRKGILYKVTLFLNLKDQEETNDDEFFTEMFEHCEDGDGFMKRFIFSKESTVNCSHQVQGCYFWQPHKKSLGIESGIILNRSCYFSNFLIWRCLIDSLRYHIDMLIRSIYLWR